MKKATHAWLSVLLTTSLLAPMSVSGAVVAASPTVTVTSPTATTTGATTINFSDLNGVSAADVAAIQRAVQLGLLHGDSSGQFRPNDHLSRQEVAVVLVEALQLPLADRATSFKDVDPNGWGSRYIEAARVAGLMQGDADGTYRPNDLITRQEMAVVLMRAAQQNLISDSTAAQQMSDWGDVKSWAQPYVQTALSLGAMGETDGLFAPTAAVKRVDIANLLLDTFFPTAHDAQLQKVTDTSAQINGVTYQLSDHVKGILNANNQAILQGANIRFDFTDRTIDRITSLGITASGTAAGDSEAENSNNLVLDGHGTTLDGDLTMSGDYLSVNNLTVAGNFTIGKELQNDFLAALLTVQGTTSINGGSSNTVTFENSTLQDVNVDKQDVHVQTMGSTVQNMDLSSGATIQTDSSSTVDNTTIGTGADQVDLEGTFPQVTVQTTDSTSITGQADMNTLTVASGSDVSVSTTGSVGTLQVNDPSANVSVGSTCTVNKVSLGAGVSASAVTIMKPQATPNGSSTITKTQPLQNLVMTAGGPSTTIDLSQYFSGSGTISYQVSSSSSSVATVTNSPSSASSWTIQPISAGTAVITVKVTGRSSLTVPFQVTVNPAQVQVPVVAQAPSDRTLLISTTDDTIDLTKVFSDSGATLNYTATSSDSSVLTASVSGSTVNLDALTAGTSTVTLTADDGNGNQVSTTFKVTVNTPPTGSIPDQTQTLGAGDVQVDLGTYITDPDSDPLTYQASIDDPTLAMVSVDSSTNKLTLTPKKTGSGTVTVTASDGRGGQLTVTFTLTINPDQPPVVAQAPADQTITIGASDDTIDLTNAFTDPDQNQDTLTYSADSSDPTVVTASVSGSTLTLHAVAVGTATINLTADDGRGGQVSTSLKVTVNAASTTNQAPTVVSSIYEQVLTPGVTNDRNYDLSQLFNDPDGDSMTYTVTVATPSNAGATVNGSTLTLSAGTAAGSTDVTVTADDGKGGVTPYTFTVLTAPLVAGGQITIHTKQGVKDPLTYDLSQLFPGQTSFTTFTGTADSTFTGPTTISGTSMSLTTDPLDTWVIGADGTAAVINVVVDPQGPSGLYFSQYLDGGDGRIALQFYYDGDTSQTADMSGYELDVYKWMKNTNTMNVESNPMQVVDPTGPSLIIPYIVIDSIFYDFFDISNASYYNFDTMLYDPTNYNVVAYVLKHNGQIVDVLGDPNSHNQFLPNGGTIVRKSGIYSGSQTFSLYGEWNDLPITYAYIGTHTP